MFDKKWTPEGLNQMAGGCMLDHLGIEFLGLEGDCLTARMPVDERTRQPYGILHGGASVVLAETLGSVAAMMCIDNSRYVPMGMEINANHLRPVKSGFVTGKTKSIHLGRKSHVWQIVITNEEEKLVCISRITMAINEMEKK